MSTLYTSTMNAESRILQAATEAFSAYGYRRASVEEIARRAGLSRTAVYNHFSTKRRIFDALIESLHRRALSGARAAAASKDAAPRRLLAALEAKFAFFYDLLAASEHGDELLQAHDEDAGEGDASFREDYLDLLSGILDSTAEARAAVRRIGTSREAAELLYLGAHGLQGEGAWRPTPNEYRRRLSRLVATFWPRPRPDLKETEP